MLNQSRNPNNQNFHYVLWLSYGQIYVKTKVFDIFPAPERNTKMGQKSLVTMHDNPWNLLYYISKFLTWHI